MKPKHYISDKILGSLCALDDYDNLTLLQLQYLLDVDHYDVYDAYDVNRGDYAKYERAYSQLRNMSKADESVRLVEKFKPEYDTRINCVCFRLTDLGEELMLLLDSADRKYLTTLHDFGMRSLTDVRLFTLLQDGPIINKDLFDRAGDLGYFYSRSVLCRFTHNALGMPYGNRSAFSDVPIIDTKVSHGNNKIVALTARGKTLFKKAAAGYNKHYTLF